jgi:hypothetical protein
MDDRAIPVLKTSFFAGGKIAKRGFGASNQDDIWNQLKP